MPRDSLAKPLVKRLSLEQWAGALAVLCLAIAALLVGKPSFSNASLPVRGIDDPVIAIQAARSLTDVDWVLGNAPSPDREVMRIKQRVGFAFIGAYTALFLTLALLLLRTGGFGRIAGPAATICAFATAGFNVAENLAVMRILDVPLYETTAPMIGAIRSASFATWALAALTLALLSALFLRSPRVIMRCVGGLFLVTAAMQLYGLRDNRFLVWEGGPAALTLVGVAIALLLRRPRVVVHLALLMLGAGSIRAEVKQIRSYRTHESTERNVQSAMVVTPEQDVLSFIPKKSGPWRLTRVRNWLDKNPIEHTIDVSGIEAATSLDLLVTPDGRFATCVATALKNIDGQRGGTIDNLISIVDLRTFEIVSSVHQEGNGEHSVDAGGHLILKEQASRGGLPLVISQSKDSEYGYPCRSAGVTRDGLFRWESCQTMGHSFFWENPTITDRHENIFSTKTGAQIGVVKETTRDTVNSRFAEHDGRDYLLVMEGGTQLKVYEITEPHP
jgi:hypothetical protein